MCMYVKLDKANIYRKPFSGKYSLCNVLVANSVNVKIFESR